MGTNTQQTRDRTTWSTEAGASLFDYILLVLTVAVVAMIGLAGTGRQVAQVNCEAAVALMADPNLRPLFSGGTYLAEDVRGCVFSHYNMDDRGSEGR